MVHVLVPGMGVDMDTSRDMQQLIDARMERFIDADRSCYTHVFDYRFSTVKKAYVDYFKNWKMSKFTTSERVRRLVQLLETYLNQNEPVHVVAHSHGGLLVHRALQHLGRKRKGQVLDVHVLTAGSPRFVPARTNTYVIRSAINVMNESDWIWGRFHARHAKDLENAERNKVHRIVDKRGHEVDLYIQKVDHPAIREDGELSHLLYFSLGQRYGIPVLDPSLLRAPKKWSASAIHARLEEFMLGVPIPGMRRRKISETNPQIGTTSCRGKRASRPTAKRPAKPQRARPRTRRARTTTTAPATRKTRRA